MLSWSERPSEIAGLFNPAFCALVINKTVQKYYEQKRNGMPFALSFLILPVVLHPPTREALPQKPNALLHPWLQNNSQLRVGFPTRARNLVPYTKEALIFGMQAKIINITEDALIEPGKKTGKPTWDSGSEAYQIVEKAGFLGTWYAKIQDISNIFILWGIRP